jgi:hypothetical protein
MLLWWLYEADGFGYLILQLRQVCRKECGGQWCVGVLNLQQVRIENVTETGVSAGKDDLNLK